MSLKSTFQERLVQAMKSKGLNQNQLAEKAGLSIQSINQYCSNGKNQRLPNLETFQIIADKLEVPYDFLLGKTESMKRENIDISEKLGLSDKAIEALERLVKNDEENITFLDFLFPHVNFEEFIRNCLVYSYYNADILVNGYENEKIVSEEDLQIIAATDYLANKGFIVLGKGEKAYMYKNLAENDCESLIEDYAQKVFRKMNKEKLEELNFLNPNYKILEEETDNA